VKENRFSHISDQELLQYYYETKDQQWIGVLLERYTLLLLGVCMKYLKNEEEAKDAVQQIFLKVLTEVTKYKVDYFKSWLYMIAKNHCLMKLRNKSAKNLRELNEDVAVEHSETDKQEILANEKTYSLLEEAIEELSEEQKLCITLFYLQKKSYQQIIEQTGLTPMQVKSYIQNGKRNLRLFLEKKLRKSNTNS
jgi:RNA polymerase sigma factor (sigma-70 family)